MQTFPLDPLPKYVGPPVRMPGSSFCIPFLAGLVLLVPEPASILIQVSVMERAFSEQYRRVWHASYQSSKKFLPFLY